MNIKLTISYLGTNYCGWQVQNNALSVQEMLQNAVQSVFGKRYDVKGCSRTDSGVHANNFCCCIYTEGNSHIPEEKLPLALNRYLPDDISVKNAQYVPESFHPRYDVKYKEYEYVIWNVSEKNPFMSDRAYHYPKRLDEKVMDNAAKSFIGKHDFTSFMASGSSIVDAVREIYYFDVVRSDDVITIKVAADGFLYNMVRILAGTLIEVSEGKIQTDSISDIIKSKDRNKAGYTVPPHGLYLNKVVY